MQIPPHIYVAISACLKITPGLVSDNGNWRVKRQLGEDGKMYLLPKPLYVSVCQIIKKRKIATWSARYRKM